MTAFRNEPLQVERDETEAERIDRDFNELLGELRVALPGVQVLFAFLLTVPFAQGFTSLTQFERDLYLVVLLLTALASALLMAPTAYHRVLFRRGYKPQILFFANRAAMTGLGVLALAMTGAILLIAHVIFGEAASIDTAPKLVHLADGAAIAYDILILATGATHSYFGHPEWERAAPGLKTIEDALEIRRRVLVAFENAERETDAEAQKAWLTFVIVGAGPTGVELAGALSEIARHTMTRDFRRINPSSARVILLEGKDRVLPVYPPSLSAKAAAQLRKLGVEVITDAVVTRVNDREVCIGDTTIAARTVLWAAGVQASPLARSLGAPLDRAGRVLVERDLTIPGHRDAFVIGDLAAVEDVPGPRRSRKASTRPRTSSAPSKGSRCARSTTATKARSPPSDAPRAWRTSGGSN